MGAALYVVVQTHPETLDLSMDGKALSDASPKLNRLCKTLGVTPLDDFYSDDPAELVEFFAEELEGEDIDPSSASPEEWFDPEQGINTVSTLIKHLEAEPESVREAVYVLDDLRRVYEILNECKNANLVWHLALDI